MARWTRRGSHASVRRGLGLELFDEHALTYPTADLGLTRWY